ncbi:MAG: response regulator, partial [Candidatus Omnitrophota bacterium]
RIYLPAIPKRTPEVLEQEKPDIEKEKEIKPASVFSGTVLVVDDEPTVLNMVASLVKHLGFNVLTASDGVEALKIYRAQANTVTCVLLDVIMPRMDGITTLKKLKELNPDVKVILTSGYSPEDIKERFSSKELEPVFLRKPYGLAKLSEAFKKTLDN